MGGEIASLGQSRRKRAAFFDLHPRCCFCAGENAATTIDHVPSRNHFLGRIAPEGYEFPACDKCQAATANIEQLVAFVTKFSTDDPSGPQRADFERRLSAIQNNFPEVYRSLSVSAAKTKRLAKEGKLPVPPGVLPSQVPVVSLGHPAMVSAFDLYARKLFLALHYHHVGAIVPRAGRIVYVRYTNVHLMLGRVPSQLFGSLGGIPRLRRQKTELSDEFEYRFGIEDSTKTSVFFVAHGKSLAMAGTVLPDPSILDWPPDARVLEPFEW